jgi:hypothetical protein
VPLLTDRTLYVLILTNELNLNFEFANSPADETPVLTQGFHFALNELIVCLCMVYFNNAVIF